MIARSLMRATATVALLSALGTGARAEFGSFTFQTTVSPIIVPGTSPVVITLVPLSNNVVASANGGGTDIVFGNIIVNADQLGNGQTVTLTNVPYTFSVTLTDQPNTVQQ